MLIAQPWGRQYQDRGNLSSEQRTTAQIQQELYYKRLAFCNPHLWEAICESFAMGDHWPNIDELKAAINANSPAKIQDPLIEPNWSLAPEPIALMMAYAKREGVSIKDATFHIFPKWIKENPNHSEIQNAKNFLLSAQGNFSAKTS